MKIAVVIRQVPDLIEPLELADSEKEIDLDGATFLVNESDDHALEQAILLKEAGGGSVTAVAIDFGDVDDTLYAAAAKGADQIIKIAYDEEQPPAPAAAAALYAQVLKELEADLVLVGVYAHDELESSVAPLLAAAVELPYVGVICGVKATDGGSVQAFKEFPGAMMAEMTVKLPAVLGVLAAEQPPRYVPVSRIRAAMKSTTFDEKELEASVEASAVTIDRLYPPETGEHAEMLEGSENEVVARLVQILSEKGVVS